MLQREKQYREKEAISYSLLSSFNDDFKQGKFLERKTSSGFSIGSLVDSLLTCPETIEDDYCISQYAIPTGLMGKFCEKMIELLPDCENEEDINSAEYEAYSYSEFKIKFETVKDKYYKQAKDYVEFIINNQGKNIITANDYDIASSIVLLVKTGMFTKHLFVEKENWNTLYQVPLYFTYKGQECKALLDMLLINHKTKTIYPIDFKTSGFSLYYFEKSIKKFNYWLQAAWYTLACQISYPGYTVKPFRFVVMDQSGYTTPIIYRMSSKDLSFGITGGVIKNTNYKIKGYDQLIDDLVWHRENDIWVAPREIYEKSGEIETNLFE